MFESRIVSMSLLLGGLLVGMEHAQVFSKAAPPSARPIEAVTFADATSRSLLDRAETALGGKTRLAGIVTLVLSSRFQNVRIRFPDQYQIQRRTAIGKMIVSFDGRRMWSMQSSGDERETGAAPKVVEDEVIAGNARRTLTGYSFQYRLRPLERHPVKARYAGRASYGALSGEMVEYDDGHGWRVGLLLDPATGRPSGLLRRSAASGDAVASGEILSELADYRDVNGVLMPFKIIERSVTSTRAVEQTLATLTFDKIAVNEPLNVSDFVLRSKP